MPLYHHYIYYDDPWAMLQISQTQRQVSYLLFFITTHLDCSTFSTLLYTFFVF